ncbi:MAG: ABC transporter ATP-binding protein [Thermoprotei archaeon]|mgnify:CR=1 FL=1|nr:MAG: ABC transporter ATP-binding protein [Thermoprotei archaeon]RLE98438.1 MAG: ABC transporter ATP-binding protein [Thermoprotei archaeon]HDI75308.1 ABC transporter ATP-binding protein [Thermoprotei archaeon]
MSRAVLKLQNITKIYKVSKEVEVKALDNVTLEVYEGEVLCIMGPSGSGKSTLLNIMGTLDRPTSGRVIVDGVDVTDLNEKELTRLRCLKLGFVFQMYNLISTLTALENVMLPMFFSGRYTLRECKERALILLKLVGLERWASHRPNQLSGGQQQRVAIARALANEPSVILMDEPTGAIDIVSAAGILRLVKCLNEYLGVTFVIVTHNPELAQIAHRTVFIRDGRLFYSMEEALKLRITSEYDYSVLEAQLKLLELTAKGLKRMVEEGVMSPQEYERSKEDILKKLNRIKEKLSKSDLRSLMKKK